MSQKHTETPTSVPPAQPEHPGPAAPPPSIIQPIVDDLKGRYPTQAPQADEAAPPRGPLHPPQPNPPQADEAVPPRGPRHPPQPNPPKAAELDHDPGGGYNRDHTYPQT